jgi:hypothetical protein
MNLVKPCNGLRAPLYLLVLLIVPLRTSAQQAPPDPVALYNQALATVSAADAFSVHIDKQFDVLMLDDA